MSRFARTLQTLSGALPLVVTLAVGAWLSGPPAALHRQVPQALALTMAYSGVAVSKAAAGNTSDTRGAAPANTGAAQPRHAGDL